MVYYISHNAFPKNRRSEITELNRKIFVTLFTAIFAVSLGMGIVGPLMPLYAESMGATGIWLGAVFSAFGLARFLLSPYIGAYSDKKGRKSLIRVGLFMYTILSILYIFASNIPQLIGVRFVHGIASAMVTPVALAYVGDIAPEKKEGSTFGTFNVAMMFGMGFGPTLGGILGDKFGQNMAFLSMGALTFLSFILVMVFLPESRYRKMRTKKSWHLLKYRDMQAVFIFRFVNFLGRGSIMTFLAVYTNSLGIPLWQIGILLAANLLTSAFCQPFFGRAADKYDKVQLILLGSLLCIVPLAMMPSAIYFWQFIVLNFVFGLGGAMVIPTTLALVSRTGRKGGMGSVMGLQESALSGGMMAGPLIAGMVMDLYGIEWVFISMALICLIGTMLFFFLIYRVGKECA